MDCKGTSKSCGKMTKLAWVFVIIGALNWGLVGFFGFDLVASIFGNMSFWARLVYAIVGISGAMLLCGCKSCGKNTGTCDSSKDMKGCGDCGSCTTCKVGNMKDHAKAMMDDAKDIAEDIKEEVEEKVEAVKDAVKGDDK